MLELTQAVILVGGKGTRLGSLTTNAPKPFLEVGDKPFLDYLIGNVARHGISEIILLTGYCGEQIIDHYDGQMINGATVKCVQESEPLGTAGALVNAKEHLNDTFLFLNGDSLFDINYLDLSVLPVQGDWVAKMALRQQKGLRYGRVKVTDKNQISEFYAPEEESDPNPINGGIYVVKKTILEWIPTMPCSIEQDVFPVLAEKGLLGGKCYDGFFIDIGVPEDFARAQIEIPEHMTRPAVFLDRDGVLNHDYGYVHKIDDFDWLEGAKSAVKWLNDQGYYVFVVTNQAGVAKGYYQEDDIVTLHHWVVRELAACGAHIDGFFYSPYHPDGVVEKYCKLSACRKPGDGMLQQAFRAWPVDKAHSFLIGDKESDVQAAEKAGIAGHLFTEGDLKQKVQSVAEA
jgi:D-glycero-D-manno-heptose 1,7-bisphosphate phosphatase